MKDSLTDAALTNMYVQQVTAMGILGAYDVAVDNEGLKLNFTGSTKSSVDTPPMPTERNF